jgi:hypothetical protein
MAWLADLIVKLAALFFGRTPPVVVEAEKAGAAQAQARDAEAQDEADRRAAAAAQAGLAAAVGASAERLRAPGDPDCRDCGA